MRAILAAGGMCAAAGCASMSADQCASADWRAHGYEDGAAGAGPGAANRRAEACYKHGILIDHAAYQAGRDEGLWVYCAPARGYDVGAAGGRYAGACINHNEADYLDAFAAGEELFAFTQPVDIARRELAAVEAEAQDITDTLIEYATGTRPFEEENHNEKALKLWAKRRWLRREAIPYWRAELRYAERNLAGYEARLAAGDPNAGFTAPEPFAGPAAYRGPTRQDAREMVAEVFADAARAGRRDD